MTEDRLRKVLELERSKRFGDRAVTAGLDAFLKNLTTHEGSQLSSEVFAQIQALPEAGYRSMTPARRRAWIEEALRALRLQAGSAKREAGSRAGETGSGTREARERPPEHLRIGAADAGGSASSPAKRPAAGARSAVATARKPAASQLRLQAAQARFSPGELEGLGVDAPIYALKRVPFALGVKFDKLHVQTVRELLLLFP